MSKRLPLLSDLIIEKGDKVFVRIDCNVPLSDNGEIEDDFRLTSVLQTLKYIKDAGGIAIIAGAIGRPKGKFDEGLVTQAIAGYFRKNLYSDTGCMYLYENEDFGSQGDVQEEIGELEPGEAFVLQNLRFREEEESNDNNFAKQLASLADYYVNDAFGQSHRNQASICAITKYLPSYAGFCLAREVEALENVLENGKDPVVAIIGGAKVSDKMKVIEKLLDRCDKVIIGGGMGYTFMKSQGAEIGNSLCEDEYLDVAKEWFATGKIVIPSDWVVADDINSTDTQIVDTILPSQSGFDIGPKSIKTFGEIINSANTILWNGPMGVFEKEQFATGTIEIANIVANASAYTVVGGGDSVSAIRQYNLENKIDHVSTGGGATLEYIEQGTLVGVDALLD